MSTNSASLEDPEDNATFVSEMRPALGKYFKRKTGNPVEAEDLAQDVLLSALTHPNWNILAWLTPVAVILIMVLGGMAMANRMR